MPSQATPRRRASSPAVPRPTAGEPPDGLLDYAAVGDAGGLQSHSQAARVGDESDLGLRLQHIEREQQELLSDIGVSPSEPPSNLRAKSPKTSVSSASEQPSSRLPLCRAS
jgi:hypothetical protein